MKIKNFFKLLKFEFKRLFRNKTVISLFLIFSVVMLVAVFLINKYPQTVKIAVYGDGVDTQTAMQKIVNNHMAENIVFVETENFSEGEKLLKTGKVVLFMVVKETSGTQSCTLYYDKTNPATNALVPAVDSKKNEMTFQELSRILKDDYGVTINEEYFKTIRISPIQSQAITEVVSIYTMIVAVTISIILMFGISYSTARDNESNISQNLKYMPIGKNKYIATKIAPFAVLGAFEMLVVLFLGKLLFKIDYQINIFVVWLTSLLFVLSTCSLGSLFGSFKSQIAAVLFDMLVIILPMFCSSVMLFSGLGIWLKGILYLFPITPFMFLSSAMVFGGTFAEEYMIVLIVQTVLYYLLNLVILKHKIKN